jgi:hypothetical protein
MRNGIRCRTTVKTWPGRSGRIRAYGSFWCTGVPPIFPRAPILPGNPGVWPGSRPARTTLHHRTRPPGPPARPRLARNGADQTRTVASIVNRQAEWPSAQLAWPVLGACVSPAPVHRHIAARQGELSSLSPVTCARCRGGSGLRGRSGASQYTGSTAEPGSTTVTGESRRLGWHQWRQQRSASAATCKLTAGCPGP